MVMSPRGVRKNDLSTTISLRRQPDSSLIEYPENTKSKLLANMGQLVMLRSMYTLYVHVVLILLCLSISPALPDGISRYGSLKLILYPSNAEISYT